MDPNSGRFYREPTEDEKKAMKRLFQEASQPRERPESKPVPKLNIPKDWPRFGVGDIYEQGGKKITVTDIRHGYMTVQTDADFSQGSRVRINEYDFYVTRVKPRGHFDLRAMNGILKGKSK